MKRRSRSCVVYKMYYFRCAIRAMITFKRMMLVLFCDIRNKFLLLSLHVTRRCGKCPMTKMTSSDDDDDERHEIYDSKIAMEY